MKPIYNNPPAQVIERRRALVASMVARGGTIREIASRLEKAGEINPETEQPWNHATIGRDIQALREEWKEAASKVIEEHKARMLAELQAVKADAWKVKELRTVLEALKGERQLLGLDSAQKVENKNVNFSVDTRPEMTMEERARRITELLRIAEMRELEQGDEVSGNTLN